MGPRLADAVQDAGPPQGLDDRYIIDKELCSLLPHCPVTDRCDGWVGPPLTHEVQERVVARRVLGHNKVPLTTRGLMSLWWCGRGRSHDYIMPVPYTHFDPVTVAVKTGLITPGDYTPHSPRHPPFAGRNLSEWSTGPPPMRVGKPEESIGHSRALRHHLTDCVLHVVG